MKIGNIELGPGICLAPMAGVTDLPFRLLCREQGCSLAATEMISAKAVYYHNTGTSKLLATEKEDRPLAVQLFGSDPELVSEIAERLEDGPWDIIDFNMGCPVPKVVNNGEGSALLKDPVLAGKILAAMTGKIKKPVTVKIRIGFDKDHVNAVETAKILEDAGASAITVHGRTREQFYSGKADREMIRKVKEAVKIPVIGNGDIFSAEDAARMMEETGCDGVMIARGAMGNPWIFSRTAAYLKTGKLLPAPAPAERKAMILKHLDMQISRDGEKYAIPKMRSQIGWYLKGVKNAASIRNEINMTCDRKKIEELIGQAFS